MPMRLSVAVVFALFSTTFGCGRLDYGKDGSADTARDTVVDGGPDRGVDSAEQDAVDATDGSSVDSSCSDGHQDVVPECGCPGIDAQDAAPDVEVESVSVPRLVDPGSTVAVTFHLRGPAHGTFSYQLVAASGGGSFSPFENMMSFDATGAATLEVAYAAPSTAGKFTHKIVLDGAVQKTFDVDVKPLQVKLGYPDIRETTATFPGGFLGGFRITVAELATLRRFGVVSTASPDAGANTCRMALYNDANGAPYERVIVGPLMSVGAGVNEGSVPQGAPGASLAPGQYWLVMSCDADQDLWASSGTLSYHWAILDNGDLQNFPLTFEDAMTPTDFNPTSMYIVVAN